MSTEEELAKRTKLSKFANRHGYSTVDELIEAMEHEKNTALARIKIWNESQNPNSGRNTNKTSLRINNKNNQNADTVNTDNK
jgi:hypothetical protein